MTTFFSTLFRRRSSSSRRAAACTRRTFGAWTSNGARQLNKLPNLADFLFKAFLGQFLSYFRFHTASDLGLCLRVNAPHLFPQTPSTSLPCPSSTLRSSAIPCSSAYFRTSSVIFIEQKCGPHIEQKCAIFAPSGGQRLVVEFARGFRVQAEIKLVLPAKFKTRFAQRIIALLARPDDPSPDQPRAPRSCKQ